MADLLEDIRDRVVITEAAPKNTTTILDPDAFAMLGVDNALNIEKFQQDVEVRPISLTEDTFEFDLVNAEAPFANALRRVILSETPTMAFENIAIRNNTSVMADEVFAHRLGLVPLNVDPEEFDFVEDGGSFTPSNCVVFRLQVTAPPETTHDAPFCVYSSHLQWIPIGDQAARFAHKPIRPLIEDILLLKLSKHQQLDIELYAVKGTGEVHAKWSPVGTAWYRMLPEVRLDADMLTADQHQALANSCPKNVFTVEDGVVRVTNARACSVCRECLRLGIAPEALKLFRNNKHFIFKIEAASGLAPERIVGLALEVLMEKADAVAQGLENTNLNVEDESSSDEEEEEEAVEEAAE